MTLCVVDDFHIAIGPVPYTGVRRTQVDTDRQTLDFFAHFFVLLVLGVLVMSFSRSNWGNFQQIFFFCFHQGVAAFLNPMQKFVNIHMQFSLYATTPPSVVKS